MKSANFKYSMIIGLLHVVALFPLWFLYGCSSALSFVAHRIVRYRLKVVRKNLRNAFPSKSRKELRKIERRFYRHLCDIIIETIKLLHISDSQLEKRLKLENTELIYNIADSNRPIILFLAHYCNWEWVPAVTLTLSRPKKMGALYKPLRNKVMNRVTLRLRSRFDSVCIPVKSAYRTLVEMRRQSPSFMIGFIADQRPLGINIKHWTEFLNQRTSFFAGGETIGDRINARYVYLDMERTGRGRYTMTFKEIKPLEDGEEFPYTRSFFRMLEQTIELRPAFWLWSHNRWKPLKINN